MSEFCGNCEFLSPAEYNQLKGDIHICRKFGVQVLYSGHHPEIKRAFECLNLDNIISFEEGKKKLEQEKRSTAIKNVLKLTEHYFE